MTEAATERVDRIAVRWSCEEQQKREEWKAKKDELVARWRNGENVTLRFAYGEPAILRVVNGEVQTGHHASVPLEHAKALLDTVYKVRERGEDFIANGHSIRVGYYKVERISATDQDGTTLHIGCHKISWAEIQKTAPAVEAAIATIAAAPKATEETTNA